MGKLNRPTVTEPHKSSARRRNTYNILRESPVPGEAQTVDTVPMTDNQSTILALSAGQSDSDDRARNRRATMPLALPPSQGDRGYTHGINLVQSRTPSITPATPTPTAQSPTKCPPSSTNPLLRGSDSPHIVQDRCPSILECPDSHKGDAQASPSPEQDTTDVSPIDMAVRHIRESGCSARAEALQTVGALLKRICQQKFEKQHVRNVFLTTCTDVFARDAFDNVDEIARAFQLLCVLVQEDIMQGDDIIRAAEMLCEEGHHDGCKLLVALVLGDRKLKLPKDETDILIDIVSNLDDGKVKAG